MTFFSSPEISRKICDFLLEDLFFRRTLARCVLGSWPRESLSSKSRVLGFGFFLGSSLALASSLVFLIF